MEGKDKTIYCIVCTGKSGSSLLASILAKAGADFHLDPTDQWDPVKGSMEHPLAHEAYKYISRHEKIKESIIPNVFFEKYLVSKRNKVLRQLQDIPYLKSASLVWVVPHLARMGSEVKVIISARDFDFFAKSQHKKFGWGYNRIKKSFLDVYATAILQLKSFGGVIVHYDDLIDSRNEAWAKGLEKVTGISSEKLIAARSEISKERKSEDVHLPFADEEVRKVEDFLKANKNIPF